MPSRILDAKIDPLTPLECCWPPPGKYAGDDLTLLAPVSFTVWLHSGETLTGTAPKYFHTDLASDPLDRKGRWDHGSVIHDWLYHNRGRVWVQAADGQYREVTLTRRECDDIFYFVMRQCRPERPLPVQGVFRNAWRQVKHGISWGWYAVMDRGTWVVVRMFGRERWEDDD